MPGRLFLTIVFLSLSPIASAQVYKWTDENGVVHYGDEQPETSHQRFQFKGYTEIQMRDNVRVRDRIAKENRQSSQRQEEKSSYQERQERLAKEREAKRKSAKCQGYRDRIEWIDNRLRAGGYSVGLGNRLRAERRDLHGKLAWECLRN